MMNGLTQVTSFEVSKWSKQCKHPHNGKKKGKWLESN